MDKNLSHDIKHIENTLNKTVALALEYYNAQKELPPSRLVHDLPSQSLPEEGIGADRTLELFKKNYAASMANSAGPRYFGFVTGGSTPAAVAGDWLVSVYDQVMSGSADSVAHALERQTIRFLIDFFNLGKGFSGIFVTGATMSNFVSLATARQWIGEVHGVDFSEEGLGAVQVPILSATPHSSVIKSLSMLGLGRKALHYVDTLPGREAIDIEKLEEKLKSIDQPCIVVANAGTVNTVDFDDLHAIGLLKKKYNFWLHVDAAFGGFAAVSPAYSHLVRGLDMADTVTIDAHKWMNVPYDAAMQFTRHRELQVKVFKNNAAYLGDPNVVPDSMHVTPENSRRFRALPAWFSLTAYGRAGYREIVERNCALAQKLAELISSTDELMVLAPVKMNVVCFTFNKPETTMAEIQQFLEWVRDDGQVFFTPTIYKGSPAIRAAISNWQSQEQDIDLAFEVLQKLARQTFSEVG